MTVPFTSEVLALCYVRSRWADAWVQIPDLVAVTVQDQAAPAHATATLRYEYGAAWLPAVGTRSGHTAFTVMPPLDIGGKYVKIVTADWSWYGVIQEVDQARNADLIISGSANVPNGVQTFTAFGMSLVLEQGPGIYASLVKDAEGVSRFVGRAFPVNKLLDSSRSDYNRSDSGNWFQLVGSDRLVWNESQFLEYLVSTFPPQDLAGTSYIPISLVGASAFGQQMPAFEYEGQTLWQVLNRIISRRRGLGFNVIVDNSVTPEALRVNVWSYSPVAVELPGSVTIPANPVQASLNLSAALNVTREVVSESYAQRYDQVRVIGEYQGSVCSVDPLRGMIPGWSAGGQILYNEGRSEDADWADLSTEEKIRRNTELRSSDAKMEVFSWWQLDSDWDQIVVTRDLAEHYVFPQMLPNGTIPTAVAEPSAIQLHVHTAALRVADYLPMDVGVDYSGEVTPDLSSGYDQLKPQVWFDHQLAERLDAQADFEDVDDARRWNVSVKVQEDTAGLIFQVNGGQQHFIAQDLYESNGSWEDIRPEDQAIDSDDWVATVYLQSQQRVTAVYPANADVAGDDFLKTFDVRLPNMHFDILLPGTIVGVEYVEDGYGDLQRRYQEAVGGILRDDRLAMQQQAVMIWQWIAAPRRILDVEFTAVNAVIPVGTLYTAIGGAAGALTVNTVVTSVKIDLATGSTAIKTAAAELDVFGGQAI